MHPPTSRLLPLLFAASAFACDTDPSRRPLGAVCDAPAQCESSLCVQSLCIAPAGCAGALSADDGDSLAYACMTGLVALEISPLAATAQSGGTVAFKADGVFGVSGDDAPLEAHTLAETRADLTSLVQWSAIGPVSFSTPGSPGLATISADASGSITISASISGLTAPDQAEPRTVTSTTTLTIGLDDCVDEDGDGYCQPEDCDDGLSVVFPGATELCNGIDDNCDLVIDEGCAE